MDGEKLEGKYNLKELIGELERVIRWQRKGGRK